MRREITSSTQKQKERKEGEDKRRQRRSVESRTDKKETNQSKKGCFFSLGSVTQTELEYLVC